MIKRFCDCCGGEIQGKVFSNMAKGGVVLDKVNVDVEITYCIKKEGHNNCGELCSSCMERAFTEAVSQWKKALKEKSQ